jgi:plasmid segregation protein ParM
MMKVPHIDLLVVGLPVALLALKKAALEKAMTGSHEIAAGRTLTVGKALAVAQPQGALVHYAAEHEKMASIGNEQSLVIDPGSRTFDWLVCRGMRLVQKQSHSINRGMSDVLRLMAAEISKDIGTPTATTTPSTSPCAPASAGDLPEPYDMAAPAHRRERGTAGRVDDAPVDRDARACRTSSSSAARSFKKAVKAAFPKHRIHEVKEPCTRT